MQNFGTLPKRTSVTADISSAVSEYQGATQGIPTPHRSAEPSPPLFIEEVP